MTVVLVTAGAMLFTGVAGLVATGLMKATGYEPEPREPTVKRPVRRASLREVVSSFREFGR